MTDQPPKPHALVAATTDHALTWRHAPNEFSARGFSATRSATADERRALAAELEILEVTSLDVSYRITSGGRRRDGTSRAPELRLTGTLIATVVQACVATLEPVAARIEEPMSIELRAAAEIDPAAPVDPLEEADLEPLDADGAVPLGRIVYEVLAAALDPFPRAPGAEFNWTDPADRGDTGTAGRPSPFAALAQLKAKARAKPDPDAT